jgi:hypothetical protein
MGKEFFDLLGLGVPFYLAAVTYAVFAWLDNNASDEATQVISSWLHGRFHNKPDLGNLIINAFDRIYTSPLLSFRAFRRSATVSTIIWLLMIILSFSYVFRPWVGYPFFLSTVFTELLPGLFLTIMSDYISLPFVRWFLNLAKTYPIAASLLATTVGLMVIAISFFTFLSLVFIAPELMSHDFSILLYTLVFMFTSLKLKMLIALNYPMRSAFVIHLWLPLFALSSLLAKLVFMIFRAVEKAQWFLKQGDAHPLKAIGVVATIIVFGSAMLVKEGWTVL